MEEFNAKQREPISETRPPTVVRVYHRNPELEKRARQVGTIAGQVVSLLRKTTNLSEHHGRLDDLRFKASRRTDDIRQRVSTRAEQWRDVLREKSAHFGRRAKAGYEQTRQSTGQMGHDYPFHVLLGAAITGFVLGAVLRARRTHAI